MVTHSLKGLFLLFLTVLSGCSSFTRFMIVNRTNASLMVSYGPPVGFFDLNDERFENCFEDDIGSAYFPEVIESSRIEAHYSEWRKLTSVRSPLAVGWVAVRKPNTQMFNHDTICQF